MKIAIVAAGFTPARPIKLRRAMATFKRVRHHRHLPAEDDRRHAGARLRPRLRRALLPSDRGLRRVRLPREPRRQAPPLLVYASAWLKCSTTRRRLRALLNAQPMGFYAPAQIVRDAIRHGVREYSRRRCQCLQWVSRGSALVSQQPASILPAHLLRMVPLPDPRRMAPVPGDTAIMTAGSIPPGTGRGGPPEGRWVGSPADIRTTHAIRLGLREIKGFAQDDAAALIVARRGCSYTPCATVAEDRPYPRRPSNGWPTVMPSPVSNPSPARRCVAKRSAASATATAIAVFAVACPRVSLALPPP